jgi:DNA repair exonuclease SbcCD nuclease subunit
MTIDILSDLHLDFYFDIRKPLSKYAVYSIFDPIFSNNQKRQCGDVLIIAGDIGHYNKQNIEVLKLFKEKYYSHIICVLGNHDYYLIDNSQRELYTYNSYNRTNEMKKLINQEDGIYCLDGNIVEIDGVKFGGAMGWYSNAYLKAYYPLLAVNQQSINNMWKNCSNDSKFIYGIENYDDLYLSEYPKLEAVNKECDVMISHINPGFKDAHISQAYIGQQSNTFFTFNGYNLMYEGNMKYWIFGHTHDELEYEVDGVKCVCTPLGYPSESHYGDWTWIKSIEI